ncbi:NAD(P)-dependent oxidoreductase [Candidatus Aerophobetes bacterium]|nr:NAD(P)-dependent oxidoreductase [Candidatus Aerophobetes bacterium]
MLNLPEKLEQLEKEGNTIKVGIVGVGQMGQGVVNVISQMKGMDVLAIADIERQRALSIFEEVGISRKNIFSEDDVEACERALEKGMRVATGNAKLLPSLRSIDVIVEATGIPTVGAEVAFLSIMQKKHIIMMNVETDVTVGHILLGLAQRSGVVYTVGAGDEPGATKELYDFATSVGFKVVAAGKGKNNPLDREATPESLHKIALKKGTNPKMLCEFVDGSKTMIEMCALANATGLVPDTRGMHGPDCELNELTSTFALKAKGGILSQEGVVDYAIGNIAPGVFVVITTENKRLVQDLEYMSMGKGPNYLLYRPYHLTSVEIPLSIARAVLYGEPTIIPSGKPVAEAITVAKRNLPAEHTIDGIGLFDIYGSIEKAPVAHKENLLPLGLAEGAILKISVKKGNFITRAQVELPEESILVNLRRLQEKTFLD